MTKSTFTERMALSVEEAGRALGISKTSAYIAARNGELPTIKIGRRLLVPRIALQQLLDAAKDGKKPITVAK